MKIACEKCNKIIDAYFADKYVTITKKDENIVLCKSCYDKFNDWLYGDEEEYALRIARKGGIEALEREVKYRGTHNSVRGVDASELTAVARAMCSKELMFVATASATAMADYMHMPPSVVLDYLKEFNRLVDVYRVDEDAFNKAQEKLNRNVGLNECVRSYQIIEKSEEEENERD